MAMRRAEQTMGCFPEAVNHRWISSQVPYIHGSIGIELGKILIRPWAWTNLDEMGGGRFIVNRNRRKNT